MWSISSTDAVLFDLDGTLVDTAEDFIHVLNHQRQLHGKEPLPDQIIRDTVSDGARALTALAFGGKPGDDDFEKKRLELLELYAIKAGDQARLFDGMEDVLNHFKANNTPWGIVTNKPRRFTDILLEKIGLNARCAVTICPDEVSKSKPDPESLFLAAEKLNLPPQNIVYVGDHARDIVAGKAADMPTVAAAYGYIMDKSTIPNWQADQIIDKPIDLIKLIN